MNAISKQRMNMYNVELDLQMSRKRNYAPLPARGGEGGGGGILGSLQSTDSLVALVKHRIYQYDFNEIMEETHPTGGGWGQIAITSCQIAEL